MTKKEYIEKNMINVGENNVALCFNYLSQNLINIGSIDEILFIDTRAGDGNFYKYLEGFEHRVAYDPNTKFRGLRRKDFLDVEIDEIETDAEYKLFLGLPPVREFTEYIEKSIKLGADFIAFITPVSSTNKKHRKIYKDSGYELIFNKQLPSNDYYLPNGDIWKMDLYFTIISKNEHLNKLPKQIESNLTYKDIFEIYTINTTTLTIRESSQPLLFKDGRIPRNRRTGEEYELFLDEKGFKYYYQDGINLDMLDKCDLYLPLRYYPSNENGMVLYKKFDEKLFGKIGFGFKLKRGYSLRKGLEKGTFIVEEIMPNRTLKTVALMDEETVRSFYSIKRYNNGVYVSGKKIIQSSKKGIL